MAYTNEWSNLSPTGSTPAKQIDEEFRKLRVDIEERMEEFVEDWEADPVVLKDTAGGPATSKVMHIPGWAFRCDNDIAFNSTGVTVAEDSDLFCPVILPVGATITGFKAMVIPGLGTMTVRLGYTSHGTSSPTFTTVDSNTQAGGSSIKVVENSDEDLAHEVAVDRYYLLWVTTDSSLLNQSKIFGVEIIYDIDNAKQTL